MLVSGRGRDVRRTPRGERTRTRRDASGLAGAATMVRYDPPRRFVVKKRGAVLRETRELDSPWIGEIRGGDAIVCDASRIAGDRVRLRVRGHALGPGWVSGKCLRGDGDAVDVDALPFPLEAAPSAAKRFASAPARTSKARRVDAAG